jgi:DNA-binding transcriptional MerR regulator
VQLDRGELGISYRQLDHWCRRGYLKPEANPGSGYGREFSDSEVEVAKLMAQLVHAGFQAGKAAKVARRVKTSGVTRLRIADGVILVLAEPKSQEIRITFSEEEPTVSTGC